MAELVVKVVVLSLVLGGLWFLKLYLPGEVPEEEGEEEGVRPRLLKLRKIPVLCGVCAGGGFYLCFFFTR